MKALVGAFNQEEALVGAFPVIVKPMDRVTALLITPYCLDNAPGEQEITSV